MAQLAKTFATKPDDHLDSDFQVPYGSGGENQFLI